MRFASFAIESNSNALVLFLLLLLSVGTTAAAADGDGDGNGGNGGNDGNNNGNGWEPAPFMDRPPFGLDSTHTFGFVLGGKAHAIAGNVRIPQFDYCGDCRGAKNETTGEDVTPYEDFSDAWFSYDPESGWTDRGPHPGGARGYSQGDVMDRGTDDEILYWGLGQARAVDEDGNDLVFHPRWAFDDEGNYALLPNRTSYPRLTDWWSFDGTDWKRLADFPGIGRTHPAVAASNGIVYVGLGFGELCPSSGVEDHPCAATEFSYHEDPRGKSGNLRDVWAYEVATDTWSEVPDFPYAAHHPMHFGMSTEGSDDGDGGGAFFVAGHDGGIVRNRVWEIVVVDDEGSADEKKHYAWTERTSIPSFGRVAGTQFDHEGYGYVLGGETSSSLDDAMHGFGNSAEHGKDPDRVKEDHRSMPTNEFWRFDPSKKDDQDAWTPLPTTPDDGSRWAASSFVLDGYVYTFQGVIRKGHFQHGNFTQVWPQQGYRLRIDGGDDEEDDEDDDPPSSSAAVAAMVTVVVGAIASAAALLPAMEWL
eukprot:CAMPEP_0197182574 /NCGR_PEP_ID=MMETSP1423-20130617/6486_1 /TAXON_ID=476441 /ORGANISM="Pseudo-nitzschia heimii, Strain UNC1101" /LENGTH=531 /DNA_ID=CAMNT_0042633017 /DNA_START=42 /DNA_END=1640 /DNA_ORIENTATION=-